MATEENKIPQLLHGLAMQYMKQMEACGCDPTDPSAVASFIKGCHIEGKIRGIIIEVLEE